MVNASTPMLNAKAARQWTVTTLRMCWLVISTSAVANAIPQVKAVVRALDLTATQALAKAAMRTNTAGDARRLAQEFAAQLAHRA